MKLKRTLLMVAVYPGVEPFLNDYFSSVNKQTYKGFDILILNDNLNDSYLNWAPSDSIVLDIPDGLNIAQIREYGIKYAVENNYRNLIFSDADDYFSNNRVELSVKELKDYNFVFNNIEPVDVHRKMLSTDFSLYDTKVGEQYSYKKLLDYNIFGMSNTGLQVRFLDNYFIPEDAYAIDWWIFTILILNGAKGKFIDSATTFYRQTDDNLVGMKKPLNQDRLSFGINVKQAHYNNVLEYCKKRKLESAIADYSLKKQEMFELKSAVEDQEFRERYIETVNTNLDRIYKGWWSEVLPLNNWRTYAN